MALDQVYANLSTIAAASGPAYLTRRANDLFFDAHPFLAKIKEGNGIKTRKVNGGVFVVPVRIGSNPTVDNRSPRDTVPIIESPLINQAAFTPGFISGDLAFFDVDLHDNMGEAQLINLLETGMDQLTDTWIDRLSANILDETSARTPWQFLGLKDAVTNGTWAHPSDYGGITPTGDTANWAATVKDNAGDDADLIDDMNDLFNTLTFATQQVDIILTDQAGEGFYRSGMDANIRYTDVKVGDRTINAVEFRGKPVLFDRDVTNVEDLPTGTGKTWSGTPDTDGTHRYYFLNSKTWEFVWDTQWNMENAIEKNWRQPVNGFSRVKLCALRGQLICTDRRKNGVLVNVAP